MFCNASSIALVLPLDLIPVDEIRGRDLGLGCRCLLRGRNLSPPLHTGLWVSGISQHFKQRISLITEAGSSARVGLGRVIGHGG